MQIKLRLIFVTLLMQSKISHSTYCPGFNPGFFIGLKTRILDTKKNP